MLQHVIPCTYCNSVPYVTYTHTITILMGSHFNVTACRTGYVLSHYRIFPTRSYSLMDFEFNGLIVFHST